MKKRLSLFLTALLTMAVLGGCGADSTGESSQENSSKESVVQSEAVYGGSVVVGIQQDIDSLDPHKQRRQERRKFCLIFLKAW